MGGGAPTPRPPALTLRVKEKTRGLLVLPRRWVVERTFVWLGLSRRFSEDCKRLPATAKAIIYDAMARLMLCRSARAAWSDRVSASCLPDSLSETAEQIADLGKQRHSSLLMRHQAKDALSVALCLFPQGAHDVLTCTENPYEFPLTYER